jgi:hypothetical protein
MSCTSRRRAVETKPKRVAAKIKKRTPVKIKKKLIATPEEAAKEGVVGDMFASISPPSMRNNNAFGEIDISAITPEQLQAVKKVNFAIWAATSDLKVDHRPFDFQSHRYLIPLYLDDSREIVLQKAAQMGATIWMLLRLLWFCLYNSVKACLYFPTDEATGKLSKDRLKPLILSNQQLADAITDIDTVGLKQIGKHSSLYLQHMGGEATKDSVPFDMLCFDEVRLLQAGDIDQARERISHSTYKQVMQVSTAGYPGCDINRAFLGGTQNFWHVKCNCSEGFVPSEHWPDCIAVTRKKEVYLRCPRCKTRIVDPQNGQYISHVPDADYPSYHISQLISLYITPKEVWDHWQRTENIKEFYNAKLGLPYVDKENQPVKDDDLASCVNTDLSWGLTPTKHGGRIIRGMGVDQMGGNNYVVIAELHPNKKRVIHYEIIDSQNPIYKSDGCEITPFKRLYELMNEWDIDMCVIDAMPNINEATDFARAFRGRVFIAHYIEAQRDMVQWNDRPKDKVTVKRGGPKQKFKYTCLLSRYLSIDFALAEIANRNTEWAHPRSLVQMCRSLKSGLFEPLHIFETHFYQHMKSIVRQKTWLDEDAGRFKMEWINLGMDPHSIHAWNMCNTALERLRKQPLMTFA